MWRGGSIRERAAGGLQGRDSQSEGGMGKGTLGMRRAQYMAKACVVQGEHREGAHGVWQA